jgi:hypothetical protein
MDRYTQYYVNQSGGGGIGSVYKASFRVLMGHGIGSFFRGLFRFVKPLLYSGVKAVGKEALKTGSNILTDQGAVVSRIKIMTSQGATVRRIKLMTSKRAVLKTLY